MGFLVSTFTMTVADPTKAVCGIVNVVVTTVLPVVSFVKGET